MVALDGSRTRRVVWQPGCNSICNRAALHPFSTPGLHPNAAAALGTPGLHPVSTPTRLPRWGPQVWLRCSSLSTGRTAVVGATWSGTTDWCD